MGKDDGSKHFLFIILKSAVATDCFRDRRVDPAFDEIRRVWRAGIIKKGKQVRQGFSDDVANAPQARKFEFSRCVPRVEVRLVDYLPLLIELEPCVARFGRLGILKLVENIENHSRRFFFRTAAGVMRAKRDDMELTPLYRYIRPKVAGSEEKAFLSVHDKNFRPLEHFQELSPRVVRLVRREAPVDSVFLVYADQGAELVFVNVGGIENEEILLSLRRRRFEREREHGTELLPECLSRSVMPRCYFGEAVFAAKPEIEFSPQVPLADVASLASRDGSRASGAEEARRSGGCFSPVLDGIFAVRTELHEWVK